MGMDEHRPPNPGCNLGLMAKYWDSGKVKTRLGMTIGMGAAAQIHQLFVKQICVALAECGQRRFVCLAPDHQHTVFQDALQSWDQSNSWDMMSQGTGDLGQRMVRWFASVLNHSAARGVLIGADYPILSTEEFQTADALLCQHDCVLGPAADGGYYLIGLRGSWKQLGAKFQTLFADVAWSTDSVLEVTRSRLQSAGLSWTELPVREDVDTVVELNHLREQLANQDEFRQLALKIDHILAGSEFETQS